MGVTVEALRMAKRRHAENRRRGDVRSFLFGSPKEKSPYEDPAIEPQELPELGLASGLASDAQTETARPYKVLTVTSNKGGVGKTTVATNLAVFLRALHEDLPILLLGLDDQFMIDRMFALDDGPTRRNVVTGFLEGSFASAVRFGEYGVHYVPSSPNLEGLKFEVRDTQRLRTALDASGWEGLVIVDTKSDLGILTRNAIAASDLVLVPVGDDPSLREAIKIFELLSAWGLPWSRGCVLLSMIDRRIKYRSGSAGDLLECDVLSLLVSEIRQRGYPLFESVLSRSPKIESLATNPTGRTLSICNHARGSMVHKQMRHLAEEVLKRLERIPTGAPESGLG
jgi:cellulose biosynthesis protein BcsQ